MTTALVSGVGAVIGYGIVRSLKLGRPEVRVIGTDIHEHAIGQAWCDAFVRCPPVSAPEFSSFLLEVCKQHDVNCVFSGFPQEIAALNLLKGPLESQGSRVVINSAETIAIGIDKWELARALGCAPFSIRTLLVTAETRFTQLADALGCPYVVKPRSGSASKGFAVITDENEWLGIPRNESMIAQTLIGSPDEEYTAAIHGHGDGSYVASVVMRRWLGREGNTTRAEVVSDAPFRDAFKCISKMGRPIGPTNLQFRLDRGNLHLLEINPRISSSTYMRCLCGYNESLMALDHYVHGIRPKQPRVRSIRVIRYAEDRIV